MQDNKEFLKRVETLVECANRLQSRVTHRKQKVLNMAKVKTQELMKAFENLVHSLFPQKVVDKENNSVLKVFCKEKINRKKIIVNGETEETYGYRYAFDGRAVALNSMFCGAIFFPPAVTIMSFLRSVMRTYPFSIKPISPLRNHPSSVMAAFVASSRFQ